LKPEWWGLPLVQEVKYQETPVKREEEEIIIIIIVIDRYPESIILTMMSNYIAKSLLGEGFQFSLSATPICNTVHIFAMRSFPFCICRWP
jgi:hypothetical protein